MSSSGTPVERGDPPTEQVQGIVERVTFHSEESGYTVARLKVPSAHDLITIVGSFPDIHAGQTLRLGGYYREHPKYGQQFQVIWIGDFTNWTEPEAYQSAFDRLLRDLKRS